MSAGGKEPDWLGIMMNLTEIEGWDTESAMREVERMQRAFDRGV